MTCEVYKTVTSMHIHINFRLSKIELVSQSTIQHDFVSCI